MPLAGIAFQACSLNLNSAVQETAAQSSKPRWRVGPVTPM